ncbi:Metallopeptidase, catalytic domain-containing protein [Cynara cardunculus var. scolymus]|uniref:Metallopeptidase, catalytic domain-containing protein n=2 Tax=Cynara cardunculus var. scolymus TaxID=59895 RepID=A0A118DD10_CYNCS|nr:Metallopeptidase, catalytic domain-containing protein [Cynara cardunculus var. scolymus]
MGNIGNPTKLSSIESIKQLKGCCDKGSKAQGLHQLKLYLAHFGYLNYQHTNVEDEKFDDELESALKSYQKYYRLNATGTLDEATVSQMVVPRCGVPDKEIHHHGSKSLPAISFYRFFPNYPRWPPGKSQLTYAFASDYPNNHVPPVVRAFSQWSSASDYFTFSQVDDVTDADLKVSFERGDHGDGHNFDGAGGVLAHAFAPTDGRVDFDADENWSDGPGAVQNAIDFESVAVHEIGHLLGLSHSDDPDAAMYASISSGVVKGLNSDDIQGIKVLYGLN